MLSIVAAAPTAFAMRAPLAGIRMEAPAMPVEEMEPPPGPFDGVAFAKTLPGITGPLDFFDPVGFCSSETVSEGKIRFYREVELKHARVAMLAAFGFPVAEQFRKRSAFPNPGANRARRVAHPRAHT